MTNPTRADLEQLKQRIEKSRRDWTRELAKCTSPDDGYEAAAITELVASHDRDLAHLEDHLGSLRIAQTIGSTERTRYGLEIMAKHTARLMAAYGGE